MSTPLNNVVTVADLVRRETVGNVAFTRNFAITEAAAVIRKEAGRVRQMKGLAHAERDRLINRLGVLARRIEALKFKGDDDGG